MPTIGNKRVTQLVELTSVEVDPSDWLLIIDNTARKSKKIAASEFSAWLNASGSLYAIHADAADTASWAYNIVGGLVPSASWALSASWAPAAGLTPGGTYPITSSWSVSASWSPGGTQISTSWASRSLSSSHSDFSDNASNALYLVYFPGSQNGTASWAITASYVGHVVNADTASYFNNLSGLVASASYAVHADTASYVLGVSGSTSASFLVFSQNNGTASYALTAGAIQNVMNNYGMFDSMFESISGSGVNNVSVKSSTSSSKPTLIQAFGDVTLNFTMSAPYPNCSMDLIMTDRIVGTTSVVDSSIINLGAATIINSWGNPTSGSLNTSFNLAIQGNLYGEYLVEVSSSNPSLVINNSRPVRFTISSISDNVNVSSDLPLQFYVNNMFGNVTISFSSSAVPGMVQDQLSGFSQTSSLYPTWIDVANQNVNDIRYTWALPNMTTFICSDNPSLTQLSYRFPAALQTMSCDNCSISYIVSLNNTTASILNFSNNQLVTLPNLPASTSYLNCSNNPLAVLPMFLPTNLTVFFADNTFLYGTLPVLPDGVITASLVNTSLGFLAPDPLPISMSYLDIHNSNLIATMSNAPVSLSYIDISNDSFATNALVALSNDLVSNSQVSGTWKFTGYGIPTDFTLVSNIVTLNSPTRHWTVVHD